MSKLDTVFEKYTPTIGIECHVQLATKTKLFTAADNDARDKAPNTTVDPLCFGFPGVLPVLNEEVLTLAIRAGLAMKATIPELSRFERKHYFYPDLPLGYQITQLAEPVIVGGHVDAPQLDGSTKAVRIHHAHIEADAGKLTHPAGSTQSYVDLNRAGTPLIEIVSEADMHSPAEARAYVQELYKLMTYAEVTHGDLYHGNMRFDVNISLAPKGESKLGTRAEIKNLNSFRAVEKAAEYECLRQAELLDKGKLIVQETRGWNEDKQKTFSQRSKEDAHDYRYFPDPDIPPVRIPESRVEAARQAMPRMPDDYRNVFAKLGVDTSVVSVLLGDRSRAQLVADITTTEGESVGKRVANWFASVVSDDENPDGTSQLPSKVDVVELAKMADGSEVSGSGAKEIFAALLSGKSDARALASELNLLQVSDESEIMAVVEKVLSDPASQKALDDIRSGNDKAIGYLVGQVMKLSQGKANPAMAQKLIRQAISSL